MKAETMILGQNAEYSTDPEITGLNNNILVTAGSGSGKTMSLTEPFLLRTVQSSLIVTCTKRRIVNKYMPLFEKRGYKVLDLNFVKPMAGNCCYDPLASVKSYSDITFLAEAIVKSNPKKALNTTADPYWDDAAISLLSALISYVLMSVKDKDPTFSDVLKLLGSMKIDESSSRIRTALHEKFEKIERKDPDCFAVSCWNSFAGLPVRTASCVYGTLNTTVDTIFSPELRKMIASKQNVDFEDIANRKTILFLTTSAVNPSLNCFVNLFYAQMFKQLFEYAESRPSGQLPVPVRVIADDFATGSRILNFAEYISVFREKRISVMLLLQSESQLERMYGHEDATSIINNCDTYLYLGGMDLKTCRNISERLNKPLEDVLYMPIGQEIIFRRGQRPVVTQRYDILNDKLYLQVTNDYEKKVREREKEA